MALVLSPVMFHTLGSSCRICSPTGTLSFPTSPLTTPTPNPRTQMTSWWPRLSVQVMMRTWRSVSLVLVSAFPPSPAPGPCDAAGEGGDSLPHGPSPGCPAGFTLSCSPFVT